MTDDEDAFDDGDAFPRLPRLDHYLALIVS